MLAVIDNFQVSERSIYRVGKDFIARKVEERRRETRYA
jgi:hypothetical protein